LVALFVFLGGWMIAYPSLSDPQNIRYVLWKAGLHTMDPVTAAETMIGDRRSERIVVGKTKKLDSVFRTLLTSRETTLYMRACYENSAWHDKDVRFIRESPWMIVFDGDKATALVLIKGC
jgi:hypothetical protein